MIQYQVVTNYLLQLERARQLMLNDQMIRTTAAGDDGASSVLDSLCHRLVGVPLNVIRHISPERLQEMIRRGGLANSGLIPVGELLLVDAELSEKIGRFAQAIVSRLQAFCLLVDSLQFLEGEQQAEYRKKLDVLAADLESTSNDPYLRSKIESYCAKKVSA